MSEIDRLCEQVHDRYELAAKSSGWETNPESRVAWKDVPEANKATMRAALSPVADELERQQALIEALRQIRHYHMAGGKRIACNGCGRQCVKLPFIHVNDDCPVAKVERLMEGR